MIIDGHDTDEKIFIIAEIGNNHESSVSLAKQMIKEAALAGADAVKFQAITPRKLADSDERYSQLMAICLRWESFPVLRDEAVAHGVKFLCTPFDAEAVEFLDPLVPAWKIAARSMDDHVLRDAVEDTDKWIIQSVPDGACAWNHHSTYALHVVSEYPCPPERANLSEVGPYVGYSDHTIGIDACVGAAFLGARVIEKHFTTSGALAASMDKQYSSNDHVHSAAPDMFAEMVDRIRKAEVLCRRSADS